LALGRNFNGFTVGTGGLANVETVNITNSSSTVRTFIANGVTGVETYNVTGPVSVTGMDRLSTVVNVKDISDALTIPVTYADQLVVGTSDSASIGIENLGSATNAVILNIPGIETLNATVTGTTNRVSLAEAAALANLKATGTGGLTVTALPATIRTIDASGLSGTTAITVGATTNQVSSVKLGSGTGTLTVATTSLRGDASIDGGDGTDTLSLAMSGTTDVGAAYTLTQVETLALTAAAASTGNFSLDASKSSGLTTLTVANTVGGTHTIAGVTGPFTVSYAGSGSSNATVSATNTGAGSVTFTGGTATTAVTSADATTFTSAPEVTITVPQYHTATGVVTANQATKLTLTGAGTFTQATDGIVGPKVSELVVNQTGQLQTFTADFDKGTASVSPLKTLNVTSAGTVVLTGADLYSELASLTVAANGSAITLNGAAAPKISSVSLSGTGTASSVTLGALGGTSLGYGVTVTAEGLRGGLTLGTVQVGSGQTASVDLTKMAGTGTVTIGAMQAGTGSTAAAMGNSTIRINAKDSSMSGTVTFSNTAASYAKNVDIDLSGTGSTTVNLAAGTGGSITGDTVSLKVGSAATTVTVGTLTVKDQLTFQGSGLVSSNGAGTDVVINAHTNSAALNINLTGSLQEDNFLITGVSTNTAITVTGALGADGGTAGTRDIIVVNGAARATGININVSGVTGLGESSLTGGAGADTITGSVTSSDTIVGGRGADIMNGGGGGGDVFRLIDPTDTGSITTTTTVTSATGVESAFARATAYTAGNKISTTTFDKISNFQVGDTIVTNAVNTPTPATGIGIQTIGSTATAHGVGFLTSDGTTATTATSGIDMLVRGVYNASSNTFTFQTTNATDTLYVFDTNGDATGDLAAIVLVGYVLGATVDATAGTDNSTGLLGAALAS